MKNAKEERSVESKKGSKLVEAVAGIFGVGFITVSYILYPTIGPAMENYIKEFLR